MDKVKAKDLVGKVIVSEDTGRKFGVVGDVNFITESGEARELSLPARLGPGAT